MGAGSELGDVPVVLGIASVMRYRLARRGSLLKLVVEVHGTCISSGRVAGTPREAQFTEIP